MESKRAIQGETVLHFKWFKIYHGLGPFRTYEAVAILVGKSKRTIERIGAKDKWVTRAVAYDMDLEEAEVKGRIEERRRLGTLQMMRALSQREEILDEMQSRDMAKLTVADLGMMVYYLEGMWPALRSRSPRNKLPN